MKARAWIGLGCAAVLLLWACQRDRDGDGGAPASAGAQAEKTAPAPAGTDGSITLDKNQQAAIGLKTETATEQPINREIIALARIIPRLQAESQVTAPIAGRIVPESARWIPQIGARVKKGQQLAIVEQTITAPEKVQWVIDQQKAEAARDQARQEMEVRRAEAERAKNLYEKKAGSLKQFQEADLAYKLAVNHYESAARQRDIYKQTAAENNTDVKRFPILAPLSGTVVAADITPGQQITPSKTLFTIIDLERVWVEASVFEKDLQYLTRLNHVKIKTAVYPGAEFKGKLITIGDVVSTTTRTVNVFFEVPNSDRRLKIGMYAEVALPTGEKTASVAVPATALLEDRGKTLVYVQTGPDRFVRREVKTAFQNQGLAILEQGLKPGETVVARGAQELLAEQFKTRIVRNTEER